MERPRGITRVVLVILDGLRADAVPLFSARGDPRAGRAERADLCGENSRPEHHRGGDHVAVHRRAARESMASAATGSPCRAAA